MNAIPYGGKKKGADSGIDGFVHFKPDGRTTEKGRDVSGAEPDAGYDEWGDVDAEHAQRVSRDVSEDVEGRGTGVGTV